MYDLLPPKPDIHSTSKKKSATRNLTGIPDRMKNQFEQMSGLSFDDVRVHYNSCQPKQLKAFAFTQAPDVYVGPGQERHLGHELGHIIQQKKGEVRADYRKDGTAVNTCAALEREADTLEESAGFYLDYPACSLHSSSAFSPVAQLAPEDGENEVLPVGYETLHTNAEASLLPEWSRQHFKDALEDYTSDLDNYNTFGNQSPFLKGYLIDSYHKLNTEFQYLHELQKTSVIRQNAEDVRTSITAYIQNHTLNPEHYLISYEVMAQHASKIAKFDRLLQAARNTLTQTACYQTKIQTLLTQQLAVNVPINLEEHLDQHDSIRNRLSKMKTGLDGVKDNLTQNWIRLQDILTTSAINCVSTLIQSKITAGELDLNPIKVPALATLIVKNRNHKLTTANNLIAHAIDVNHLIAPNIWAASLLPARGNAYGNPCGNLIVSPHKQIPVHNTLYTTNVPDISVKRPGISDAVITSDIQNTLLGNGVDAFHVTAEAHGAISTNNPHAYRGGTVLTKWAAGSPTTEDQLDPLSQDEFINKIKPIRDTEVSSIELLLKSKIEEQRNKYLNIVEERLKATHV